MNKQSNISNKRETCQELTLPSGDSKAVTPPRKDEFLLVPEESPPFTISEHIICLLETLEGQLPQALQALPTIAESLHNIDEGIGYLCDIKERELEAYKERTEAIREEELPYPTTEKSRPFKSPPVDQGGKYVQL